MDFKTKQHGRTLLEMLAVLAIIGVLSVAALMGFRYALDKHKANSIYQDVHLLALHVMDTGKDTVPLDFYPQSGMTFGIDTTTYANGFVVTVSDVSEKVCDKIMTVDDTSIEEVYVGSEGNTTCSGFQTMGFMFLYDASLSSGGTSGGSGSGMEPEDLCENITVTQDCNLTENVMDENGCVTVKKITCAEDTYCSVGTCEPCPATETCNGESCCVLTGPEDVCGRPTKEVGTITTVTHSDLNANGCCTDTSEENCSLNPVTARTCTPTCDGTCQSDGTCRPDCESGSTYNETAGQCCEELTATACQTVTAATSGTCPTLTNAEDGTECTTTDNQSGTCQAGVCIETVFCENGDIYTLNNGEQFCSVERESAWDADTYEYLSPVSNIVAACEEQGLNMATLEELCPEWNGTVYYGGEQNCPNVTLGEGGHFIWTNIPYEAYGQTYLLAVTWDGFVTSMPYSSGIGYAFCK